jgi:hypothetical protein
MQEVRTNGSVNGYQQTNAIWAGWQRVNISTSGNNNTYNATTTSIYIYSAFYDVRFQPPTVRVMALVPKEPQMGQIWCVVFVPGSEALHPLKATIKLSE